MDLGTLRTELVRLNTECEKYLDKAPSNPRKIQKRREVGGIQDVAIRLEEALEVLDWWETYHK